jgi:hypothetical protein
MKTKTKRFDAIEMKRRAQASVREDLAGKSVEEELAYYAAANERWRKREKPTPNTKRTK